MVALRKKVKNMMCSNEKEKVARQSRGSGKPKPGHGHSTAIQRCFSVREVSTGRVQLEVAEVASKKHGTLCQ